MLYYILSAVIGYLIGSVSFAVLVCKIFYLKDIRRKGSGNPGATNAARVFGPVAGALTFLGDFLKGVAAVYVANLLAGEIGMVIGGVACMLGHCFPVFFKFKGGKAVSTGAGIALMIDWRIFAIGIAVFIVIALVTKRVSIGSIIAISLVAVLAFVFGVSLPLKILAIATSVLVIFMHRQNIKRIANGTEAEFVFGDPNKTK